MLSVEMQARGIGVQSRGGGFGCTEMRSHVEQCEIKPSALWRGGVGPLLSGGQQGKAGIVAAEHMTLESGKSGMQVWRTFRLRVVHQPRQVLGDIHVTGGGSLLVRSLLRGGSGVGRGGGNNNASRSMQGR
jgi:hypothetical protein